MSMVSFEVTKDDFDRLIFEIYLNEGAKPAQIDEVSLMASFATCDIIRAINSKEGNRLIGEFQRVSKASE